MKKSETCRLKSIEQALACEEQTYPVPYIHRPTQMVCDGRWPQIEGADVEIDYPRLVKIPTERVGAVC